MKKRMWMVVTMLALASVTRGATNDLSGLLQKGLFEEEANRNLDAAISNYQSLANAFDKDRQLAATAIFRLGECYRKLGQTNEATAQYERIVREFSDQQTLVTLSQQNLAGLGVALQNTSEPAASGNQVLARLIQQRQVEHEAQDLQILYNRLKGMNKADLRIAIEQNFPNPVLTKLLQEQADAQQHLIELKADYAPDNPHFVSAQKMLDTIDKQIDDEVEVIMNELQAQVQAAERKMERLQNEGSSSQLVGNGQANNQQPPITDEEEKEIRRIQVMIQNSPDLINAPSGDPYLTPLGRAARLGQSRVARFLIDAKADLNQWTGGMTPLQQAASHGQRAMVELLLGSGADVEATDSDGRTALQLAAQLGFVSVSETLLAAKADVNTPDGQGNTALTFAVQDGSRPLAVLLLAHGANPNVVTATVPPNYLSSENIVGTPLHFAVVRKDEPMTALLLSNRAEVNIRSPRYDKTPLDIAAENGSVEIARRLLDAGANPNPSGGSPGEYTPLHRAAGNKHLEIVKLLLSKGADPNATSDYSGGQNRTPLMAAVFSDDKEIASALLENKADPNFRDASGLTALWYSLQGQKPDTEMATLLLEHGADPNQTAYQGLTPLMFAAEANNMLPEQMESLAKTLLARGAKINAENQEENTALHFAVTSRHSQMVALLLANHADANTQNHDGKTPLDLAKESQTGQGGVSFSGVPMPPRPIRPIRSGTLNIVENTTTIPNPETNIISLLYQHGATDELPDFNAIRITREGFQRPITVFLRSSNDWNHFTVLEAIDNYYYSQPSGFGGVSVSFSDRLRSLTQSGSGPKDLPFPDLSRIIIHRPGRVPGGKGQDFKVSLLNSTNAVDCARDVPLEFGDVIEIPLREYALSETPIGLSQNQSESIDHCLTKQVRILVRSQSRDVSLHSPESYLFSALHTPETQSLLLSSSDLTRVKVSRKDSATGKTREFIVDTTKSRGPQELRLEEGDVIEVPEKP